MTTPLLSSLNPTVVLSKVSFGEAGGLVVSLDSGSETVELSTSDGTDEKSQLQVLAEGADYLRKLAARLDKLAEYEGARLDELVQDALNNDEELPPI